MGCTKPYGQNCPLGSVGCAGCGWRVPEGCVSPGYHPITPGPFKTIDQFTTAELLAEIRRRVK